MTNKWRLLGENVSQETRGLTTSRFKSDRGPAWLRLLLVLVVALLLSRAFFLQVVLGNRNQILAEGNRIETVLVPADRGVILDRYGKVLARNSLNEKDEVVREYPYGQVGAHVLGYVGPVSPAELAGCQPGDCLPFNGQVGKMGLERSADRQLRGQPGEKLIEADAAGKQVRLIAEKPAIEGDILRLNLDIELTRHIFQTLAARSQEKHTQGAVVVSRVGSNEILALVSWPGFDPNLFTQGQGEGSYRTVEQVLGDTTLLPLFNRAAAGVYPPASTYKLVTSIAGLETGQISGSTEVEDTGELVVGEFRFGTWNFDQRGQKEGNIGVVRALARSNDIFFYKVGEWVGIEQLRFWSESLGLGKRTGIELNSEATGLVPDPVEKERSTGERWFLGNTYHMAIGQGDLLASPLQVDRMTSGAISGLVCPARLISGDAREGCQEVGISQANRELVLEGMKQACAPGGTAFPFFQFEPKVACKTGTAQHGGEEAEPHAWITVVVPGMGTTELARFEAGWVITVLLEEAGEGSYEAGPVARSIAQYLVEKEGL